MSEFDQRVEDFFKNYHDRGMKKWTGFFLSDHTLKINQEEKRAHTIYQAKKTMSAAEISQLLLFAFSNHRLISIQLKEIDQEGHYQQEIAGFVQGYFEDQIIVSTKKIKLSAIKHVEIQ